MKITQSDNGDVILFQKAYAQYMLSRFNISHCILLLTPFPPGILLSMDDCPATPQEINKIKSTPYYEALGSLMWLQVAMYPDLSFIVNILSCFSHNPGKPYWNTLKYALAYVKGTIDYGIIYRGEVSLNLVGYVDLDYAGCKNSRRSTKGNCGRSCVLEKQIARNSSFIDC